MQSGMWGVIRQENKQKRNQACVESTVLVGESIHVVISPSQKIYGMHSVVTRISSLKSRHCAAYAAKQEDISC